MTVAGSGAVSSEDLKRLAATAALAEVAPGMRLGLGTGSTARHLVDLLADKVRQGLNVRCVATSEQTAEQARRLGMVIESLDDLPELDLTIDGADEIDPDLRLIKGGGAALLREKIVAMASRDLIIIADASKQVAQLGRFPLPIEVVPFGLLATMRLLEHVLAAQDLPANITLRRVADGAPLVTDGGHFIVDAHLGAIPSPETLAAALTAIPGVVEHGLFLGLARAAFVATPGGIIRLDRRPL